MKDYLLGLLDGSSSISHEGIGLVIQELNILRKVAEAAEKARWHLNAYQLQETGIDDALSELYLADHTALSQEIAKDLGEEF